MKGRKYRQLSPSAKLHSKPSFTPRLGIRPQLTGSCRRSSRQSFTSDHIVHHIVPIHSDTIYGSTSTTSFSQKPVSRLGRLLPPVCSSRWESLMYRCQSWNSLILDFKR